MEDIGKIIKNGFETYTNNLNIVVPFILNVFISGLLAVIIFFIMIFSIFGSALSLLETATSPEQIVPIIIPLISEHILEIVILIVLYIFISMFFQAFFIAGAIGMARQATETGKSDSSTMIDSGKKNVVNLYLAEILVGLLYLAGVVFIVPGAITVDIGRLTSSENIGAILLLLGGFLFWAIYMLVLSLILAVFRYILVMDNLGPIEGLTRGFRFFERHKFDVFLLWLFVGVIVLVLMVIGQIMGLIPVMNIIWPFINVLISILIIEPLTVVWWVRMYMTRTDQKIYFNDLLAHPSEIERFSANQ